MVTPARVPRHGPAGTRGSPEPLRRAGAARRPQVGQEQSELDVQVSKFDIARTEEVAEEARTLPWGYGKTRVTAHVHRCGSALHLLGGDRSCDRGRARRPRARWSGRLAQPPRVRRDRQDLRRHERAQLLRPEDRAHRSPVVLPRRQAGLVGGRRARDEVSRGILRQDRALGPGRLPAPRAVGRGRRRVADGEAGDRRDRASRDRAPSAVDGVRGRRRSARSPSPTGRVAAPTGTAWGNGEDRVVALLPGETVARRWDWQVIFPGDWQEIRRTMSWEGPLIRTSWEAGPFFVPVELPSRIEEYHTGDVRITSRDGSTRVIYGPWRVVIRGLGARAERRVLGVWEMTRTWTEGPVRLTTTRWAEGRVGPGSGRRETRGERDPRRWRERDPPPRGERDPARRGVGGVLPRRERGPARRRQRDALPRRERGPAAWGERDPARRRLGVEVPWRERAASSPAPARSWRAARASSAWRVRARCPSAAAARRASRTRVSRQPDAVQVDGGRRDTPDASGEAGGSGSEDR